MRMRRMNEDTLCHWRWILLVLVLVLVPLFVEPALLVTPSQAFAANAISQAMPGVSAPPTDAPVLPDPLQLVIGAAITFLVVNGLKDFSNFVGQDLSGWGTVIAAGVTAIVVFAINTLLQVAVTIDPALVPRVDAVFQILVILLGAMGFKRTLSAAR